MAGRLDALVNALLGQTGLTLESQVVLASTVGSGRIPRLFMIEGEYALHAWEAELVWTRRTMVHEVPRHRGLRDAELNGGVGEGS